MNLILDAPAGWTRTSSGTWSLLTSPDNQVRVEATPLLTPARLDPRGVIERAVTPPDAVRYVQLLDDVTTRDGWQMRLATLCVARDGVEREWRLAATYQMLSWVAVVVARAKSRGAYDVHRPALLELLGSARPYLWGEQPVCVAELYWKDDR